MVVLYLWQYFYLGALIAPRIKNNVAVRFRSKLLQPRTASKPTLTKIYDVQTTPNGRVEGEDQAMTNALEGAKSILHQHEKTDNGL
jgi:hypothetical protein